MKPWSIYIGGQHITDTRGAEIYEAASRFLIEHFGTDYDADHMETDLRIGPPQELRCEIDDLRFSVRPNKVSRRSGPALMVAGSVFVVIAGFLTAAIDAVCRRRPQPECPPDPPDEPDEDAPTRQDEYIAVFRWWLDDTLWKGRALPRKLCSREFDDWCFAQELLLSVRHGVQFGRQIDEHEKVDVADIVRRLEVAR